MNVPAHLTRNDQFRIVIGTLIGDDDVSMENSYDTPLVMIVSRVPEIEELVTSMERAFTMFQAPLGITEFTAMLRPDGLIVAQLADVELRMADDTGSVTERCAHLAAHADGGLIKPNRLSLWNDGTEIPDLLRSEPPGVYPVQDYSTPEPDRRPYYLAVRFTRWSSPTTVFRIGDQEAHTGDHHRERFIDWLK